MSKITTLAKAFANQTTAIAFKCPQDAANPGLYFGYVTGYERASLDAFADLIFIRSAILNGDKAEAIGHIDAAMDAIEQKCK